MSEAYLPSSFSSRKRFLFSLTLVLFVAFCFEGSATLAQTYHHSGPAPRRYHESTPAPQEGIRNVFVKMSPKLTALREEVLNNDDPIPEPELPKLIDGKHPAVGRIDVDGGGGVVYHGTGTLIGVSDAKGIVITNWHVVRDRVGEVRVRFPNGDVHVAEVVKTDKTWDLAALAISRPNIHPVALSDRVPKLGDPLTLMGYGGGVYRQSSGRMLQFCAPNMTDPTDILEVTTPSRSGDSGGPILHTDGTLAGVLFGSVDGTTNGSHCGRVQKFLTSISMDPALVIHRHEPSHAPHETIIIRGQKM